MSQFVEVTRQGLGSRTKNSMGGAVFGFVLVALGTILLFWNEGRAVKRYKDLKEGAGAVVVADSAKVDPAMDGKLVHMTGAAEVSGELTDKDFGISETAIRLNRSVEMYQWVENVSTEEDTKVGGSTETTKTYSYSKEWRPNLVSSSSFKVTDGHQNPSEMPYQSATWVSDQVTFGAFQLPEFLVKKIGGSQPLEITSKQSLPASLGDRTILSEGGFYIGESPSAPAVGDLRVSYSIVRPGPVSLVAQQNGSSFVTYRTKTGGTVDLLERGTLPADQMFQLAQDRNKAMTWAIRVGGFFMLGFGFSMILKPLAVFASVLPFLGRIAETGTSIVAFLLAGVVWSITVAIAWIFYRPILGIAILVITVVLAVLLIKRLRAGKESPASAPPPPPLDSTPPPLT
ncbi:MAG: TMEM43 family protein [Verrucomicrobiota bacterium]